MAGIQIRKMGWIRMPTAWEQTMQWKEKQLRSAERMEKLNAANSGFSNAALNNISESGSLAVKAAIKRNQDVAKAKLAAAEKAQSKARLDALL